MNIRNSFLAATSLSTMFAVPVWAGATESTASNATAHDTKSAVETNHSSVAGISARSFVGAAVHNASGERIGEIHDLIVGERYVEQV